MQITKSRYSIYIAFLSYFLIASTVIRTILLIASLKDTTFGFLSVLKIYVTGLFFDFGTGIIILALYSVYLFLMPNRFYQKKWNKILSIALFFLLILITLFSFFAELTFWQEFASRFNFIAVDYLIYTYEVINNINESYPLPLLISGMLLLAIAITYLVKRLGVFDQSFKSKTSFKKRAFISGSSLLLAVVFGLFVKNSWADNSNRRFDNELSKDGIFSFFAAFKNNELNYHDFYSLIDEKAAYQLVRKGLTDSGTRFNKNNLSIRRTITGNNSSYKPNVIMITVESLSADFLAHYGNTQQLTPVLDSLADHSIFFSNMYATGTRTVRGMEALTLAIPPTPGSSIVRRENNEHLFTIGRVFKQAGYTNTFFYGGDGYFDNMNHYFGNNGYDIVDRGRKLLEENFDGARKLITNDEVRFENAWGICDEDIFNVALKDADQKFEDKKLFNNFIMTTSNHRPFTYPPGKIKIAEGSREGAVRYTDYAIGQFLTKIKTKPWFANTIIIIVADHCASSAGKNEIDVSKYQIPCMILNMKNTAPKNIKQMSSQLDLFPTLWSLMGWSYTSNFFGKNVLDSSYQPRAVLGTYQKLVYLKADSLVILSPQRKVETFIYNKEKNEQRPAKFPKTLIDEGIAQYQTAYDLFKNGGLKY